MKIFYMLPLAGAIAALTACTPAPVKQETIVPVSPQPVAQPLVLRKVEPETSAPHYHLNPKNYEQPLNPIIVQEIREALTPKIINPATGEVVKRLPLIVPADPSIAGQNNITPTSATVALPSTSADASNSVTTPENTNANPATTSATTPNEVADTNAGSTTSVTATDSHGIAVAETQDTQAALLKIDPSLKLDEQAVTTIAASQAQSATTQTNATPVAADSQDTTETAIAVTANNAVEPVPVIPAGTTAKILIPIHQQQLAKTPSIPAPSNEMLDVTEIDKDITLIEGKARHYPTYFKDKFERWKAEKKIKQLTQRLDVLAVDPRASYDVLLRAMKSHVLARNMDAGPDSAFKSAVYFQRLLKLKPADPETSFWYGFSLGEGGGFRESISHLDIAVKADYQEAYLALAHSYLQMDDKKNALTVLNNYKIKYPDEAARTDQLITEVQAGKRYSIWQ